MVNRTHNKEPYILYIIEEFIKGNFWGDMSYE